MPQFFGTFASLTFLAFAYLGGITSVTGAALGGLLVPGGLGFTALKQWLSAGDDYTLLIGGLGLIVTAVLNPEGMAGSMRQIAARLRQLIVRSSGSPGAHEHPRAAALTVDG